MASGPSDDFAAAGEPQQAPRGGTVGAGAGVPEIELRVLAAHHGVEGHFRWGDRLRERARDHAEVQPQFPPIARPVAAAEHREAA